MTKINVLAFDVGKYMGWAFKDAIAEDSGHFGASTYVELKKALDRLMDLYTPVAVVVGKPNLAFGRRLNYNTVERHFGYIGVIKLMCEKKGIYFFPMNDKTARKIVLGNGNAKKEEVAEAFNVTSLDEADAICLAKAQYQELYRANQVPEE